MSRPSMEIVQEAIAKLEKMSSEEFHFSVFGFSEEEYKTYIKRSFKKDMQSIKEHISKKGYDCRAYEDKVKRVDWAKFFKAFMIKSKNIKEKNNNHIFLNIKEKDGSPSFKREYKGLLMYVANDKKMFTLKEKEQNEYIQR